MIDSGAKYSLIKRELLRGRSYFKIQPNSSYCMIDGTVIEGVVGEVSLMVSFKRKIVDLPRVVLLNKMVRPLILGVEWVVESGVCGGLEWKISWPYARR